MADPRIITDADTVARLAAAAKVVKLALGDDKIVMIDIDVLPVAAIGSRNEDGTWTAVAIEGGDIWHYDGDTVTAPQAPADPVHVGATAGRNGPNHLVNLSGRAGGGECICLERCCNDADENCICADCNDRDHTHHRRG